MSPARALYSLASAGIINKLISGTQNSTLHLYCEFDAQCLWCKVLMAWMVSMSEGQRWRAMLVRENREMSGTSLSFRAVKYIRRECERGPFCARNRFQFNEGRLRTQQDIFDSDLGRCGKNGKLKLVIPIHSYPHCRNLNKVKTWFCCCKWLNLRPF